MGSVSGPLLKNSHKIGKMNSKFAKFASLILKDTLNK